MKTLIIRSCDRDDLRATLCFKTALKHNVADKYIFFHEGTEHPHVDNVIRLYGSITTFIDREFCDNFGGGSNVLLFLEESKNKLPIFNDNDDVVFSDADIIFLANPFDALPADYEHAGFYDENYRIGKDILHVSGQLNFLKGYFWNLYLSNGENNYNDCREILDRFSYSIADDTVLSVFSHIMKANQYTFEPNKYWLHHKIEPNEFFHYLKQ